MPTSLALILAAAAATLAVPATAVAQQQKPTAKAETRQVGETTKKQKPAEKKICKSTPSGKACMTAEQWEQSENLI